MLVAGFFLWGYIVLTSVEFGSSLFLLFPRLVAGQDIFLTQFLSPVWEVNNVFLVGFIVSIIAFFPGFIPWFAVVLFTPICLFLIASGFRILLVLVFFYSSFERLQRLFIVRALFAVSAFAGPAIAAWGATIVLIGVAPALWLGSFAWLLLPAVFFALSSLVAFASVGIQLFRVTTHTAISGAHESSSALSVLTTLSCIVYGASAVWLFRMLPLFTAHSRATAELFWFSLILALALLVLMVGLLAHRAGVAFFGLAATAGVLVFFAIALQYPYLVFPFITAAAAFTAPATAKILFGVFGGGLILLIPSFILLYRLFIFNPK